MPKELQTCDRCVIGEEIGTGKGTDRRVQPGDVCCGRSGRAQDLERSIHSELFLILTGLQVPESVLAVAAGACFGLAEGIGLTIGVNFIGALLWFLVARHLLRGVVNTFLSRHPKLNAIEQATASQGFKLMLLLRLGPFSYGFLNLALGVSSVRLRPYLLALVGVIPGNVATVYFGSLASHVAKRSVKGASMDNLSDWHFVLMGFGFLVTLVVVVVIAHVARHTLKKYELEHPLPAADAH